MKMLKAFVLMMLLILASVLVSAQNLDVQYVKINGEQFDQAVIGNHTNNLKVERGEDLNVRVRVKALTDVSNVQLEADIYGYKYSQYEENLVSATSKTFDLNEGDVDTIDLKLQVPLKMDKKYTLLRIRVADEDGPSYEQEYELHVTGVDDNKAVVIKDYSFSPSNAVLAGRAFTSTVRVENIGNDDLNDVKVTVAVPQLNIQDTEYLDQLDADEKETLQEFLLRIPDCAQPGDYDVKITADFDEYESTSETSTITVLPGDTCPAAQPATKEKVVVSVPDVQEVKAGNEVSYPIMISNQGTTSKTFTVSVSGVESWGTSRLSPSSVVIVPAGQSKAVYLYVTPNQDAQGEKILVATITSDGDTKSVPLTANVTAAEQKSTGGLEYGLKIALIVLVIILIIVGLVIGFSKLRGGKDEGSQTYY